MTGWIGVDLDGTLAKYDGTFVNGRIGEPVPLMVARVKEYLARGEDMRIFTARVAFEAGVWLADSLGHASEALAQSERFAIEAWCVEHLGQKLPVTATKDFACTEIWDDRARQVEMNTGRFVTTPHTP